MSNRQLEDAMERRRDEYVAAQLGVPIEILADHPYQIAENASDDGLIYSWQILWDDTAPDGVTVHGSPGSRWSDLQVEPDRPHAPDY